MKINYGHVKPFKLMRVREALSEMGINGITVTARTGALDATGLQTLYRGAEYVSRPFYQK